MTPIRFGIIGGSGLYRMDGLAGMQEIAVDTPYGAPSDAIATGTLDGVPVAFLARHGRSHSTLPGDIPFQANIWALKSLGVPTELVVYPGEFHGFKRPSFIRDRYERWLAWWDKYAKGAK